jgi:tetratricopeptide (TPR) repeat protein
MCWPGRLQDYRSQTLLFVLLGSRMRSNSWAGLQRCGYAVAAAGALLFAFGPALADFDPPTKPKIDCSKAKNQKKAACRWRRSVGLSDDEIYNAAYWLAQDSKYRQALMLVAAARNPDDPRLLNVQGYATRKLGDVDRAVPFYVRALRIDPNFTLARAYLGEALLAKGDVAGARAQLVEIEVRSGRASEQFGNLARAIADYELSRRERG